MTSLARKIRIIDPVCNSSWEEETERVYQSFAQPGTQVSVASLDWGVASIESDFDIALAVPDILHQVMMAEREGIDAVIIDCMGDPGLYAARQAVRIPVVGPGQACMHTAACLEHRFAFLSVTTGGIPLYKRLAAEYGLADKLACVRSVDIPVLELQLDPAQSALRIAEEAVKAIEQEGAAVIVPGCTLMTGLIGPVRRALASAGYRVPVLDPPGVAMALVESWVALGLTHGEQAFGGVGRKVCDGRSIGRSAKDKSDDVGGSARMLLVWDECRLNCKNFV